MKSVNTLLTMANNTIFAAVMSLCLLSCAVEHDGGDEVGKTLLAEGTDAPDFLIRTGDNPEGTGLSSLRGKYVVMEFWASWCPDCRKVTPDVKDMYDTYASEDTVFVGVSFDTDASQWRQYIEDNGLGFMQHLETSGWDGSQVAEAYHVKWIPTFYLVNPDGKIEYATIEVSDLKKRLERP